MDVEVSYELQFKGSVKTGLCGPGSDLDVLVTIVEFGLKRVNDAEYTPTDMGKLDKKGRVAVSNALHRHIRSLLASEDAKKYGLQEGKAEIVDMWVPKGENGNSFVLSQYPLDGKLIKGIGSVGFITFYESTEDVLDTLLGFVADRCPVFVPMNAVLKAQFKLVGAMGARRGGLKSAALALHIVQFLSYRGILPSMEELKRLIGQKDGSVWPVATRDCIPKLCVEFIRFYVDHIIGGIDRHSSSKDNKLLVVSMADVKEGHPAVGEGNRSGKTDARIVSLLHPENSTDDLSKTLRRQNLDGIVLLDKQLRGDNMPDSEMQLVNLFVGFLGKAGVGSLEMLNISSERGNDLRKLAADGREDTQTGNVRRSPGVASARKKVKATIVYGPRAAPKNQKRVDNGRDKALYTNKAEPCTFNPLMRFAVVGDEIRECSIMLPKLFWHVHAAVNVMLAETKGKLEWKKKEVTTMGQLHSFWNGMAAAMYRCLSGKGRGTTDEKMYSHCKQYCMKAGVPLCSDDFSETEDIGWRKEPMTQMAQESAVNHETHLSTNLHIYAKRFMFVLIDSDKRFAGIKERKEVRMIISAVTYGADEKQQNENIMEIIARRPSTQKEYVKAKEAFNKATEEKNPEALNKAKLEMAAALHPDHEVWVEAQKLREEWRKVVKKGTLSDLSQRLYDLLGQCRMHGEKRLEAKALAEAANRPTSFMNCVTNRVQSVFALTGEPEAIKFTQAAKATKGKPPKVTQAIKVKATKAAKGKATKGKPPKVTQATNGPTTFRNLVKRMKWTYPLAPFKSYGMAHAYYSTTAIKALFKALARKHTYIDAILKKVEAKENGLIKKRASQADRDALYWHGLFNLERGLGRRYKKYSTDTTQLRFGNGMSTDGVHVSLQVHQRKSPKQCELLQVGWKIKDLENAIKARLPTLKEAMSLEEWKTTAADLKRELELPKEHQCEVSPELKKIVREHFEMREDGVIVEKSGEPTHKFIGADPGKKALATTAQLPSQPDGKHKTADMSSGEWSYITGQKQSTKKMNKRIKEGCPEWLGTPSLKTEDVDQLVAAIKYRVECMPKMDKLLFEDLWEAKQKMRRFVKRQQANETLTARFCGTSNKVEQKKVVIALGDADVSSNLRGLHPVASKSWVKHIMHCALAVVLVNEHKSSWGCSKCHLELQQEECFRLKRCINSDCSQRGFWNRDVNAAINILNFFLLAALHGDPSRSGWCTGTSESRPPAFRKSKQLDE